MKLKLFQKQDLARSALHDGLIFAWDTGLGKTWVTYLWPLLKVQFVRVTEPDGSTVIVPKAPVLIIAPGDLHQQIMDEGWRHFRIRTRPLSCQSDFMQLCRRPGSMLMNQTPDGRPIIPDGFYITSYTQLANNGVIPPPDPQDWPNPRQLLEYLCLKVGEHVPTCDTSGERPKDYPNLCAFFAARGFVWSDHYRTFGLHPDDNLTDLKRAMDREIEALQYYRDAKEAERQRAKLYEAHGILKMLMVDRTPPTYEKLAPEQQDFVIREYCQNRVDNWSSGIGTTKPYSLDPDKPLPTAPDGSVPVDVPVRRVKCLWSPSLADLCYNSFDCVVIDEGVKMKGEDTIVGKGVRSMEPRYRCVLTATPVKNRLPDIFRLAWWATGGKAAAHARFPYRDDTRERTKFAETFMVSENNLTKLAKAEAEGRSAGSSRFKKLTAEVCNVHRLWKLLGPIVLRRRKQDAGVDIVPRLRRVIRCELGTLQQKVYNYHLQARYLDKNGREAIGAKLQALRIAAADPTSESLETVMGGAFARCKCGTVEMKGEQKIHRYDKACPECLGKGTVALPHRSGSSYIPKMASTLTLVQEILERGEQFVIFSAFNDPLDSLSHRLDEAGVRHITLDGRVSQKKRGKLAAIFKQGRNLAAASDDELPIPGMLAGVECMAEGHSFHLANNVILIAYSWAYDKFKQALDRVHRMNSVKPVNVYVVICSGTIDRKLESLVQDKGDAAELVLDGRLIGERSEEVNLAELLQVAMREFDEKTKTIDEALLSSQWPELRDKLAVAMRAWDAGCKVVRKSNVAVPRLASAKLDRNSPFHKPRYKSQPAEADVPLEIINPPQPEERPRVEQPAPPPVQNPKPETNTPDWKARMRQRAERLARIQKSSNLWSNL